MREPKRILVVRTDRVGDVVLATPLLRALRKSFPRAHLAALVQRYTADVLLHHPHLNEILVDDPGGEHAGRQGFWKQVRMLRKHRFDTALLLLPTERHAWMLFASGIRTRVSVGFKLYEALTFMKTVSRHKYVPLRHEADYCLDLGRAIGAQPDGLATELAVTEEEKSEGRRILEGAGFGLEPSARMIIIHPGSGRSSPNWEVSHYMELADRCLQDEKVWVIVTGSREEAPALDAFLALRSPRLVLLAGRLSIRELMAIIAQSTLLVSASTGPMHLAAGLGVPTVSMFCRMSACSVDLWGPQGNRSEVVLPPEDYCANRCPGDPHVCRFEGGIAPGAVHEKITLLLGETDRLAEENSPVRSKPENFRQPGTVHHPADHGHQSL